VLSFSGMAVWHLGQVCGPADDPPEMTSAEVKMAANVTASTPPAAAVGVLDDVGSTLLDTWRKERRKTGYDVTENN
jgi:hypothetical protein